MMSRNVFWDQAQLLCFKEKSQRDTSLKYRRGELPRNFCCGVVHLTFDIWHLTFDRLSFEQS
jgi:hypothetical protein